MEEWGLGHNINMGDLLPLKPLREVSVRYTAIIQVVKNHLKFPVNPL
jgi:hypothetical protein